jgi:hypothetical protein
MGPAAKANPKTTDAAEQGYQTLAGLLVGRAPAEPIRGEDEWMELLGLAQVERVDPLVHRQVSALPGIVVPPIVSQLLSATYLGEVHASLIYESTRARLCRYLSELQIPVLLLKGCDLAFTYYDDPATRVMNDLDLLVPKARVQEAARCLEEDGFTFLSGSRAAELRRSRSHAVGVHSLTGITVELHWELKGLGSVTTAALAEIWSGARLAGFEPNGHVMRAGHLVPYLCAHVAVLHKRAYLLDFHDLHRVLLVMDPTEAEVTRDTAHRWGLASCVGLALQHVQRLFGTPLPGVLQIWSEEASTCNDLQSRIAVLALAPGATGMPNRQLLELAMGQSEQSLLRFLFPSPADIRRLLGLSAGAPVTPITYLAVTGRRLRNGPGHLRRFWSFWRAAQTQTRVQGVKSERADATASQD